MSERDELIQWVGDISNRNPFPEAEDIVDGLLELGYCKVSADEDTVERVAEAIRNDIWQAIPEQPDEFRRVARAAINAIGGGTSE